MANIIQSPFLVLIRLACVIIPPTVTQSPSRRADSSASGPSDLARIAGPTSRSGWAEMNRPIDSFSAASSSVRPNSSVGIGAWLGAANAAAAALAPPSGAGSRSKIDPWPISASCWAFWPAAWADSSTASMPLRVAPVEPKAPHLISASIAFLLTARLSMRSQKSKIEVNSPFSARARLDAPRPPRSRPP